MKPSKPRPSVHCPWLHGAQELSKEASRNDGNKWTKSCMTLRTLNYGNYGIFLGIQKPTVLGGGGGLGLGHLRFRNQVLEVSGLARVPF